ncbi:MAG: DNA repair protein RecN [Clostridia bacterium]|nr:DNA repair protein RecN [Clostridia bacterium]
MLQSLHIENIAVIEKADITFDVGLNVLTGETGAGKSIVIDAINAVLGERVTREMVRAGSEQAHVTALFTRLSPAALACLHGLDLREEEDGSLLIQRSITADGRGSCRVGGRPVTVNVLRQLGRALVNIHGQHDNQTLLQPEKHVEYLDKLGNIAPVRQAYYEAYSHLCALHRALRAADTDEQTKARQLDLLTYQIEEIEQADLQPGEEEQLLQRRDYFRHAEKVMQALQKANNAWSGSEDEDGALSRIRTAADAVEESAALLRPLEPLAGQMQQLYLAAQDIEYRLRDAAESAGIDPAEQEQVEDRLDLLRRLKAKYGPALEDVQAFLEAARQQRDAIVQSDEQIRAIREQIGPAQDRTVQLAARLTQARRETAQRFTAEVVRQLRYLDMPDVDFQVAFEKTPLFSGGAEKVEFLIAANPKEPPKPLARIASGGELSRTMLAIKSVLSKEDDVDTLVYDEIDSGISGHAALRVGEKLRETAAGRQILCVTHLAQIAAQGHTHFLIRKTAREGRAYTEVLKLDRSGRERELARIIGADVSQINLAAARELLDKTKN